MYINKQCTENKLYFKLQILYNNNNKFKKKNVY